jgi:hypothetical protein
MTLSSFIDFNNNNNNNNNNNDDDIIIIIYLFIYLFIKEYRLYIPLCNFFRTLDFAYPCKCK